MNRQIQLWFRMALVAVLGVALLVTGCRAPAPVSEPVAEVAAAPAPLVAAPVPAAGSPEGGLPREGIQVHGHWTIEVRNPDGTVAEVREFENALWNVGNNAMVNILGRNRSVGGWQIELRGGPLINGAFLTEPSWAGFIQESGGQNANSGPGYFDTLTVNVPTTGPNDNKLVLSGTAIAIRDGNIYSVNTNLHLLPNNQVPSPTYGERAQFTGTNLPGGAITLVAGQQVLVTVVISFS